MASPALTRSDTDRMIAGVCGGIAERLDVDSTLIRVLFAFSIFFGGFGVFAYVILWILLPRGRGSRPTSAIEIAEERYARGEISADELHRIRADLGGSP
ncbi:MAG TPA: PspC domain-containing protein [Solirubrobacterales bacterium]|nr:PspC domain-containing protein [Solirubrobacterales bacterium]